MEEKLDDAFARYLDMDPELSPFVDEITKEGKGWRERGVTGQMLVDLAERLGVACTVMSQNDEVVLEHRPEKPSRKYRSIACYVTSDHCYLCDTEAALRSISHKKGKLVRKVQLREPKAKDTTFEYWDGQN